MKKKIISLMLTLCMVLSLMPTVVFATDVAADAIDTFDKLQTAINDASDGETITLGDNIDNTSTIISGEIFKVLGGDKAFNVTPKIATDKKAVDKNGDNIPNGNLGTANYIKIIDMQQLK